MLALAIFEISCNQDIESKILKEIEDNSNSNYISFKEVQQVKLTIKLMLEINRLSILKYTELKLIP